MNRRALRAARRHRHGPRRLPALVPVALQGRLPVPLRDDPGARSITVTSERVLARSSSTGFLVALFESFVKPVIVAAHGSPAALVGRHLHRRRQRHRPLAGGPLHAAPTRQVADPLLIWLLLLAALYTILSSILDAVLGLNRPSVDAAERGQSIWRFLDALPDAAAQRHPREPAHAAGLRHGLPLRPRRRPRGHAAGAHPDLGPRQAPARGRRAGRPEHARTGPDHAPAARARCT